MNLPSTDSALSCSASVIANARVSSGLIRLDLELAKEQGFEPGQFAMINLAGPRAFVFSRPFSLLEADRTQVSFLYRVVGRGTRALERLRPGQVLSFLGPLGQPFPPAQDDLPVILIGGGVGLPPVWAWQRKFGRPGDLGFFGARNGSDVPWDLLGKDWSISVDVREHLPAGRLAEVGVVTDLVAKEIPEDDPTRRLVLACGPIPLLKAAAELANQRGWQCYVSLEEHMGCGYGACKGCVVPLLDVDDPAGWRNATCCQEGPVFTAESVDWLRYAGKKITTVA